MVKRYREEKTEAERKVMSAKGLARRPEACPVVIEPKDARQPTLGCGAQFLLHRDLTMSQIMTILRRKLGSNVSAAEALFLFVEDPGQDSKSQPYAAPPMSHSIGTLYDEYKFPDGFMYIIYTGESVFGG